MDLRTLITPEQDDMITHYIKSRTGETPVASLDYILREWAEQKGVLYQMLGEQLITSRYICLEAQATDIEFSLNEWMSIDDDAHDFIEHYSRILSDLLDDKKIIYDDFKALYSLVAPKVMTQRKYEEATKTFILPQGNVQLVHGQKITRALRKVCEILGIDGCDDFLTGYSRIYNTVKLEGNLCLSIHPFDYMTMSDNSLEWRSCMSWDEGCYRQGTVEMMNSPYVVVAYLESSHPYYPFEDGGDTWNNKKWRELYIVHPDMITNIKGYPYESEALSTFVVKWLKELCETNLAHRLPSDEERAALYHGDCVASDGDFDFPYAYVDDYQVYTPGRNCYPYVDLPYTDENLSPANVQLKFYTDIMYNDMLHRGTHHYIYANWRCLTFSHILLEINYSGKSECMCCGNFECIQDTEDLLCDDCKYGNKEQCTECEGFFDADEMIMFRGSYYCEHCYEQYIRRDSATSEEDYISNFVAFVPATDDCSQIYTSGDSNSQTVLYLRQSTHRCLIDRLKRLAWEVDDSQISRPWYSYNCANTVYLLPHHLIPYEEVMTKEDAEYVRNLLDRRSERGLSQSPHYFLSHAY